MSDFVNGFWGYFIGIIAVGGIVWCVWLLYTQRRWLGDQPTAGPVEDTGHVWDGDLTELNNPVPRWWTWMYLLFCVFALVYLVLFPGLGAYKGMLGYTTAGEVADKQAEQREAVKPLYARFEGMSVPQLAGDTAAREAGQRLFLSTCAQCHGSDARGAPGFPNLADNDWLHGGLPENIETSITEGRHGIMPPWGSVVDARMATDIAHYVRSMSGLASDPVRVFRGKREFGNFCVACHGVDGKGNTALGAPNLTDDVWLYGSSEASIVRTIREGRDNRMPAHKEILTPEQIRLLTAWVWGLSNRSTAAAAAPAAPASAAPAGVAATPTATAATAPAAVAAPAVATQ
ncbi:cytochrome-c oxidase, cbb3-type subunit III [Bordetella genomosp. 5]|uniref:Cbb3-type cytochrome c oxidase subunit n=1 Tax=Bordetella genomosp. 5 TaxID=1395608 RepID=A0A261TL23_9BORD|nr:cytochrome-c oxidase, cbb3-type subunit III [Bordetella genomosp. 5]OZI50309.1 cytochrome-c oxidase, cbb3-type subunit III [Bordetella genomosp. 5]